MEYRLDEPLWFNEQGQRNYNEDFVLPKKQATENDHLFMVCDGVGGSAKGDVAARVTCETFSTVMAKRIKQFTAGDYHRATQKGLLNNSLREVEKALDDTVLQHPDFDGMATTLTYLHLSEFGAVIAWAGDSRIYQFRHGRIVRQTTDHSLVNELIKLGEITPEEAKSHPRRNVISRAVSGTKSPTKLDVEIWKDIQSQDIFMLCTDGVLEGMEDKDIAQLLAQKPLEQAFDTIKANCAAKSNDNYSMVVVRVAEVKGAAKEPPASSASLEHVTVASTQEFSSADAPTKIPAPSTSDQRSDGYEKNEKQKNSATTIGLAVGLLAIVALAFFAYRYFAYNSNSPEAISFNVFSEEENSPQQARPEKEGEETCSDLDKNTKPWSDLELKRCFGPYVLAVSRSADSEKHQIFSHSDGKEFFQDWYFTEYSMIGDSVLIARRTKKDDPISSEKGLFGILSASDTQSPQTPIVEFRYDTIYRIPCRAAPLDSLLLLIESKSPGSDTTYKTYNLEEATAANCQQQ